YLSYLKRNHPDLDIASIIEASGMTEYEVEDQTHWFTQEQVDRFYNRIVEASKDPDIARKAGRYATSTAGLGASKQYLLSLLNLSTLYLLIEKVYSIFSRGASIKARKLGPNKIEIISTPQKGVKEKPYQCENRIGMFESVAKFFVQNYARVEHPECFHKDHSYCRYIITWDRENSAILKQVRNILLSVTGLATLLLYFFLSLHTWGFLALSFGLVGMSFSFVVEYLAQKELTGILRKKGSEARSLISEMKIRHDNALLVQEIGDAISSVLDIENLVKTVVHSMQMYLDFDRGIIMLSDSRKTRLAYVAGYGYDYTKESDLKRLRFHLDNPGSQGVFTRAFREQKPMLIRDVTQIENSFSDRSIKFINDMNVQSLICIPIIYKNESLGVLGVDNIKSKRPLNTSDISLLMGVASQTAVGIMNAVAFKKIRESEKKYRELVENANSIIMRINIKGQITFFNEYAQRVFGYSETEARKKKDTDTFGALMGGEGSSLGSLIEDFKQSPLETVFNESKSKLRNGEDVWIAWTYRPIFNKDNTLNEILCVGNEITALKRAEQEKAALEIRLNRAHKMEAIGTLAGGVAHDLNNILSGIVSYPQVLLRKLPDGSPLIKPIRTIQDSGKRAAAIVQDLLTLARRGVVTKETVAFNTIINEYLQSPEFKDVQNTHPHVQVKTDLLESTLNIKGSPVHLSKTVMNLVTNAFEAIEGVGEVVISIENKTVDTLIDGYDQVKNGDYVTLTVIDTGSGILPQDLERIFEPFYTKKVMGKSGTGLGMAVVWGTVKDHNGYIDVQSTPGQGTCFTLYFPAVRQPLPDTESVSGSIDGFMGKGESILIVEDIEEQRTIASEILGMLGYTVQSVASGAEAVQYIQNHPVDLLVLDMIMEPGMDGLDTYREILRLQPGQKAIMTSGFAETERVKKAIRLGAKTYIKKPYLIETIGKAVWNELNSA
ncbi:MAG: hypothetical protein DRH90_24215, partial [Deltaproteobacteria bacterium]